MTSGENAAAPSAPPGPPPGPGAALRAEHDALGEQLAARRSIDELRRALYLLFGGLISAGLTVKLAWDRWGVLKPGIVRKAHAGRPLFFLVATALTLVLLGLAIRGLLRSRALMRGEDALFARYRALRARLGLDR
ncbi:MAG TPA: hypothetical protein VF841_16820 [Anaeromyxobacter sp.]